MNQAQREKELSDGAFNLALATGLYKQGKMNKENYDEICKYINDRCEQAKNNNDN